MREKHKTMALSQFPASSNALHSFFLHLLLLFFDAHALISININFTLYTLRAHHHHYYLLHL